MNGKSIRINYGKNAPVKPEYNTAKEITGGSIYMVKGDKKDLANSWSRTIV